MALCAAVAVLLYFVLGVYGQNPPLSFALTNHCVGPGAVAFALDGSESINASNFELLKQFVKANIQHFKIGPSNIQVAAFVFSQAIGDDGFPFDSQDTNYTLFAKVDALKLIRMATFTDVAITEMIRLLIQPNVPYPKVGVILTDGASYDPVKTQTAAAAARTLGVTLISVGIGVSPGSAAAAELTAITGNPSQVLLLNGYSQLTNLTGVAILSDLLCRAITTSTSTTTTTTPVPTTTTSTPIPTTQRPTTPTPTLPPLTTQKLQTDKITNPLCEGCIIADGVGYNRHGSNCQRFVQCYFEDDKAVAVEKKCGFGQFFSLSHLTCVHAEYSDCPYDPCIGQPDGASWNMAENCQGYWTCINGHSVPTCCGNQTRYVTGSGCAADVTCTEACPPKPTTVAFLCESQADPDPSYYLQNVSGALLRRRCAPGTHYDAGSCGCSILVTISPSAVCSPMLYHSQSDPYFYDATNIIPVGMVNVAITTGSRGFGGNGEINIWRLANQDFQDVLVVRFELTVGTSAIPRTEQVLVNCLHSNGAMTPASVDIQVIKTSTATQLVYTLRAGGTSKTLTSPVTPGVATEVIYAYDGSTFAVYSGPGTESSTNLREVFCDGRVSLVIAMDSSSSLTSIQFLQIKNFTANGLVKRFMYPHTIATVAFAENVEIVTDFGELNSDKIMMYNSNRNYQTRIDYAIGNMTDMLSSSPFLDPDVPKVALILTDGKSTSGIELLHSAAMYADRNNVYVMAVGVGEERNLSPAELNNMTHGIQEHQKIIPYKELASSLDKVVEQICYLSQNGAMRTGEIRGRYLLTIVFDVTIQSLDLTKEFISRLLEYIEFGNPSMNLIIATLADGAASIGRFDETASLIEVRKFLDHMTTRDHEYFDAVLAYKKVESDFLYAPGDSSKMALFITDKPLHKSGFAYTRVFLNSKSKSSNVQIMYLGIGSAVNPDFSLALASSKVANRIIVSNQSLLSSGLNNIVRAIGTELLKYPVPRNVNHR
ncbi:uncharacterized protein LOC134243763, partial [Saccostrea cucullata]|uniref:uncharacterized protein LOC134243763 n=1 Tax=Saccostrea cuccullata TaxID=36930 RepID=UPI002ED06FA4